MRVLFDHQAFDMQRLGGVSNSFVRLIENLPGDVEYKIAVKECDNFHLRDAGIIDVGSMKQPVDKFIIKKHFPGQGVLYDMYSRVFPNKTSLGRNRLYSIHELKAGEYDVFHPTFFDDYFLNYLNGKPFVLTIHDMIPERLGVNDVQVDRKKRLAKMAAQIIAVSENTKKDIIDILKIPEDRITVIYHGAPVFDVNKTTKPLVDGKYILFVGDRVGYKCFLPMMKSLIPVLKTHQDIRIVCTGKSFTKSETDFFAENQIGHQVIHCRPDDQGIMNLYQHAECFIYPSLYEGFGIPILEAYKANCPLLLNRSSCFPEIAGDAAVFFSLSETSSDLTEVLNGFLNQTPSEREELLARQRNRLALYSWKQSAQKLRDVYRSVLSK